ncbi:hypothetical protein AWC15_05000 [Mycobacterium lacus]|uniref:Uncharacterized protein n=1 Tax=Mycobacterium lacus TaxID=169765 RepID=A0A1X1XY35_9MYCO|nr:hypothetical protein [Mycobacterium lacus]ORW03670.1 hypothetical protein AWC15_05000 [Mycobacterium lacus]BBX95635.1 hypothetical protein MLAC_09290 [Mycobacterium lacus]
MTMNAKRRRAHDKLAKLPGVRPVRRPVSPEGDQEITCARAAGARNPVVIIPGGPGMASATVEHALPPMPLPRRRFSYA